MKALIVGTGGVGESMAAIAKRRDPEGEIFEPLDPDAVAALAKMHGAEIICNCLPVFANLPVMQAALRGGVHYLDTGMCDDPDPMPDGAGRKVTHARTS